MIPVSKEAMTRRAYSNVEGTFAGPMNNLDLGMGYRMWSGVGEEDPGQVFDWSKIHRQYRYNPESGYYYSKFKDIHQVVQFPSERLQEWDDMISERPLSYINSAMRAASAFNERGDLDLLAAILVAALLAIESDQIRATRIICPKIIVPMIQKFYATAGGISLYQMPGPPNEDIVSVWIARSSLDPKSVKTAEKWVVCEDQTDSAKRVFDYVTGMSDYRKRVMKKIIDETRKSCKQLGVSDVYLVGGFPRALAMNEKLIDIRDLDFSGAWPEQCLKVGGVVAERLGVRETKTFHRTMTLSWDWKGVKCDFRGNFTRPGTRKLMKEAGIKVTPLNLDVFSRDITINMLIFSLADGRVYDITGEAKRDLDAGIIRTYFDPDRSLQDSPLTVLRAIKYATRYNFSIEKALSDAMKKHGKLIFDGRYTDERLRVGCLEILAEGKDRGLRLIEYYGVQEACDPSLLA